ncbi:dnaK protein [Histomonas meleagridis]|uniref:dnaK protein n=1 Tax=Histomonas meleagridis TaxID=135588 RepID=UPI00355A9F3E|nr:dnaK protein [Histomonas meleagridis]KAH0801278.1 dnaK protein [Histomonas meleagridis]
MWIAAGFDFGNENYVVGVPKNGVEIAQSQSSNRISPTMITYTGTRRYVGEPSLHQQMIYLDSTVSQLKRLVCLPFRSKEREVIQDMVSFTLTETDDGYTGVKIPFKEETIIMRPEQCIASILKDMDKMAKTVEPKISKYIVAVSPWWPEKHRRTLLNACKIADIQCLSLVNSTTAAAIAYTMTHPEKLQSEKSEPYVFIDFGNSSMNVAVALLKRGNIEIKSFATDNHLGGSYFTTPLIQYLLDKVKQKYNIDPTTNPRAMARFRSTVEQVKKTLSINPVVTFEIQSLLNDIDVSILIKREEFESQIKELLDRIELPIQHALDSSGYKIEDIKSIELLGGGSRVPSVQNRISLIFGKEPSRSLNLDECFAIGTGYYAALLSPTKFKIDLVVKDITPYSVIAEWSDGHPKEKEIFQQFSVIPSINEITLKVVKKSEVKLRSNGEEIIHIELNTNVEKEVDVILRIKLNQSSIIEIECAKYKEENGTEIPVEIKATIPEMLTKEKLEEYQKLEAEMSESDLNEEKIDDIRNELESKIFNLQSIIKDSKDYIEPNEKLPEIQKQLEDIQNWYSENEFDRLPINEYETKLNLIIDLIKPINAHINKYNETIEKIPNIQSKLEKILKTIEEDKSNLDDNDLVQIRDEITSNINKLKETLNTPKYNEIDFDENSYNEKIKEFETKSKEIIEKKQQQQKQKEKEQQQQQQEQSWRAEAKEDPRRQRENLRRKFMEQQQMYDNDENEEEEEEYIDPWSAIFGIPSIRRNRYPRRKQYNPELLEAKRRAEEEAQRERQKEAERRAELQRRAEELRRQKLIEEEERRKKEEEMLRKQQEEEMRRRKAAQNMWGSEESPFQRIFVNDDDDNDEDEEQQQQQQQYEEPDIWSNMFGIPSRVRQRPRQEEIPQYRRPQRRIQRDPWGGPMMWQNPFF